ncbi:PaaI family thioesterase [Nocardia sp. MH4]|uniref:PaaI family thioesterase n=1 Tax=Nocardia sp. MH4 TaxID=1768677 RepID=UPI0035A881DD
MGAPAIAHGGAVATVLDDLFGFLLYSVEELAVTRHLAIDYLAPVLLDTAYTLRAHIHARDGRKLHLRATIENDHAQVVTTATALFLIVDIDHFLTPRHTNPTRR